MFSNGTYKMWSQQAADNINRDHIKQQITLTVTTLSSFHCRSSLVDYENYFMKNIK